MYQKNPEFACEECHKSFKNQRALNAHNRDAHSDREVSGEIRDRSAAGVFTRRWDGPIPAGNEDDS